MNESQLRWAKRFKWISLAEGLSFLLLLGIAMPLKYGFDMPLAVKYTGWYMEFCLWFTSMQFTPPQRV